MKHSNYIPSTEKLRELGYKNSAVDRSDVFWKMQEYSRAIFTGRQVLTKISLAAAHEGMIELQVSHSGNWMRFCVESEHDFDRLLVQWTSAL